MVISASARETLWRQRGGQGEYPFYCLSSFLLQGVLVDFETRSFVYRSKRYLLDAPLFDLFVFLLYKERQPVDLLGLAEAIGVRSQKHYRVSVSRTLRQLEQKLSVLDRPNPLQRSLGCWCLHVPEPEGAHD